MNAADFLDAGYEGLQAVCAGKTSDWLDRLFVSFLLEYIDNEITAMEEAAKDFLLERADYIYKGEESYGN